MTVKELLQRMDSSELTEWIAYFKTYADDEEAGQIRQSTLTRLKRKLRAK